MKRYILHEHYEATPANDSYYGKPDAVQDYYIAKGGEVYRKFINLLRHEEYSYHRRPTRELNQMIAGNKEEMKLGYWIVTADIIEFEV